MSVPRRNLWMIADVSPTQHEPTKTALEADNNTRSARAAEDVNVAPAILHMADAPSDDECAAAFEASIEAHAPRAKARVLRTWDAGRWSCLQEDFERLDSRDRWLSGDGLAVFAAAKLEEVGVKTVGLIHPGLLQEVQWRMDALAAGDAVNAAANERSITIALKEVRALQ